MRNSPDIAERRFAHSGAYLFTRCCKQLQGQATQVSIQARHGVEPASDGLRECPRASPQRRKRLIYAGKRITDKDGSRKLKEGGAWR